MKHPMEKLEAGIRSCGVVTLIVDNKDDKVREFIAINYYSFFCKLRSNKLTFFCRSSCDEAVNIWFEFIGGKFHVQPETPSTINRTLRNIRETEKNVSPNLKHQIKVDKRQMIHGENANSSGPSIEKHEPDYLLSSDVLENDQSYRSSGTSGDLIKFMGEDRTAFGERRFKYMILKKLMVNLYSGDLLRLDSVDAIVVPLQPGLNGGVLADEVKKIGGKSYKQDLGKYSKSKVEDVFVCRTSRKMKIIHVIFVPITSTEKKSLISYANVCKCILTTDNASIQTIAMPLFGAARFSEEKDLRNLGQCLLSEIIDTNSVCKRLPIKELHLVNKAYNITDLLQALMKQWSFGTPAQTVPTLMHMYPGASGVSKGSYLSKDAAEYALNTGGWIKH